MGAILVLKKSQFKNILTFATYSSYKLTRQPNKAFCFVINKGILFGYGINLLKTTNSTTIG